MPKIPAFLLGALQFGEPRRDKLRHVSDSEWKAVLSNWHTARLMMSVRQDASDDFPDWVRSRLDTYLSDTALRFERIKAAYSTVAKALSELDADHVVIKGFSLWPGYAEHPRFRPQGDIDLYCPPETILRARDALIALGYTPNREQEHLATDHLCTLMPEMSWEPNGNLFDPDMPICLELHFCWWNESIMRFCPTGLEQFWARRIMRRIDELSFPGLEAADNLAYTSLNVVRDLLRGHPAPEQVYGLARFLHTQAGDPAFWRRWRELHDDSLRRLQAISFCLASDWFNCRLPEEVREEQDRLTGPIKAWLREFLRCGIDSYFGSAKEGFWLHQEFLDSFRKKSYVLLRDLFFTVGFSLSAPACADEFQDARKEKRKWPCRILGACLEAVRYAGSFAQRGAVRLAKLPVFFWRALRFWQSTLSFGRQFWTFLAASFCFDFGMTIFFFLYNLYLLDRGFKETFLGTMTSLMNIGTIACTIPAGILIERLGLRKSLLLCFVAVSCISAGRALLSPKPALLAFAFLGGFVTTIWAVAISPAVTRLTNDKSRPLGFSLVFSSGIGIGILANIAASRMPGWFVHLRPVLSIAQAKQWALLLACAIVAVGLLPASRLNLPLEPVKEKRLCPRNPFLLRFLPAVALWSLVTGSLSPLANVYFSQYLRMPLERIGSVFSLSSLFQVVAVLAAPLLFRGFGLIPAIASTQLAIGILLACLAAVRGATPSAVIYVAYSGLLWMSEPGLFSLLMSRVAPAEQAGASALNFLVISLTQAIAVAAAGASLARFGYPAVLCAMAGVALISALFFRVMLRNDALPSQPSQVKVASEVPVA
jgi:predicted MFS family arabinose efflux permease